MGLNEADTRAKLIDPALHARGWSEDLIKREESAGAIEIIAGTPRRNARGRVDYTLRVKVTPDGQPVHERSTDRFNPPSTSTAKPGRPVLSSATV